MGNFPLSPRITTLLLARNRVSSIQPSLAKAIPNLKNLVLSSNNLAELADLDALAGFPRLTHLVLVDNPASKKEVSFGCCWDRWRVLTWSRTTDTGCSGDAPRCDSWITKRSRRRNGRRRGSFLEPRKSPRLWLQRYTTNSAVLRIAY